MKQLYYVMQTLLRGRGSNVVKVISLGLGLTMSILLFSRVAYEQSFDTCFHENDRLYQLWMLWEVNGEVWPPQEQCVGKLAGGVLEAMPDLVESAATTGRWGVTAPLYNGNVQFNEYKVAADSLFFQTMGVKVLSGNPVQDLAQKDVIYLSDRLAQKMFGDENPIGKVISYDKKWELTIRGTYAAIPDNSTMNPKAVISMPTLWSRNINNYSWNGGDSWKEYIRLKQPCRDLEALNRRVNEVVQQNAPKMDGFGISAQAAPIRDTYRGYEEVRRMRNIMSILGAAILFITALNYVLISISSLARRAKAIGVHKCSGAGTGTVFGMFLWETAFIILGALLLMALLLLNFRDFVEDTAAAKLSSLFAADRLWVPVSVTLLLFLVGGVLPGRIFAKIPVTQVFRRYTEGKKGWKRPLLFVQFAGVTFIGGLLCVVMLQYRYVLDKDTGYNPSRMAIGNHSVSRADGDAVRHFYENLPYVEQVSASWGYPSGGYSGEMIPDEAGNNLFSTRYDYCRENYAAVMGMTVLQGRPQRERGEVMVNQEFARRMHWGDEVLGRTIQTEEGRVKVVGLLKDFQIEDFTQEPMPYVMHCMDYFSYCINLRLKEPFAENLQRLNREAAEAFPDKTIAFESLEKMMADDYNSMRVFRNATLVAALAILFITLMGLIGYINDEVQRRSKEIAIRKVNGAEASMILELLTRDVLWTSVPAVLVGGVAAWYVNNLWMDMFAVTIGSPIPYYICIAIAVLVLIVACVVSKAWRIANENPVLSIKSE